MIFCPEKGKLKPAELKGHCAAERNIFHPTTFTAMLDGFEILTTSGVVLWSKAYAPVSSSLINGFIKDVFIEEKLLPGATAADETSAAQNPSYRKEKYTLRWASVKELGLIFVVRMPADRTS